MSRWKAYQLVRAGAALVAPGEFRRRRRAARRLAAEPARLPPIPQEAGFLAFDAGDLPGSDAAIETSLKIWESVLTGTRQPATLRKGYKKQEFLVPVMLGDSAVEHPAILDFVLSPAVLQTVTRYLGSVPVLAKVDILWTKPNATSRSSQLFHMDTADSTELKLFLHVLDVDESSGPFTVLSAAATRRILKELGYDGGRVDDAEILARSTSAERAAITGPKGSGVFADTARCFHFGSRENQRDRVMLVAQFISYFGANFKATTWGPALRASGRELDPMERMVMPD